MDEWTTKEDRDQELLVAIGDYLKLLREERGEVVLSTPRLIHAKVYVIEHRGDGSYRNVVFEVGRK